MQCPNCELLSMNDTKERQHDNCIVWFCPRCGRRWTFLSNGTIRTVQETWDVKYIEYLHTSEKMPKPYINELLKLYPEYVSTPRVMTLRK